MTEIFTIIKQTVVITFFVMLMMIVLEFFAVQTRGRAVKNFSDKPFLQIFFSALMGIIPGCMGTYAVVSMYIHGSIRFGALVAALIATSGDEAFLMFTMLSPKDLMLISAALFALSLLSGWLVNLIFKKPIIPEKMKKHIVIHKEEAGCKPFNKGVFLKQLKNIRPVRIISLLLLSGFIVMILAGEAKTHEHKQSVTHKEHTHEHEHEHSHEAPEQKHGNMMHWQQIAFLIVAAAGFIIALVSPDHFLEKHIWGHVIKKHFLRIFLWTLGALIVLHILNHNFDFADRISENKNAGYILLLLAVLVGIIPESGPHIIFLTLFTGGYIPFSILLANSIVQDGHGAIPLLAETGRGFIRAKAVNALIGLLVGGVLLSAGL